MSLDPIRAEIGHAGTSSLHDATNRPGWSCHHGAKLAFDANRPADADIGRRTADPDGRPQMTRRPARPGRIRVVRLRTSNDPGPDTAASASAHHLKPGNDPVSPEARNFAGSTSDRRRT